ncbi:hypothetical protein B0J11DRAFT_509338 [Dendryphion nanum]|uniref:Uncharacterized protein n=1 Tax=Dendryphion nanum TaxID=256645 RepID=A0A9P9IEB7_9PLEO|nr:hypothetical protein B0J11DRAFT_509338 [Dendryphion nanum]
MPRHSRRTWKLVEIKLGARVVKVRLDHGQLEVVDRKVFDVLGAHVNELEFTDSKGHRVPFEWRHLQHGQILDAARKSATGSRSGDKEERMAAILTFWGLSSAAEILPADIVPRVRLLTGGVGINPGAEPLDPPLWPKNFVFALWRLAVNSPGAHKDAVSIVEEVVRGRWAEGGELAQVPEVMKGDLERAWAVRKERVVALAGEVLEVEMYAGQMWEGIESVEREMEEKKEREKELEEELKKKGEESAWGFTLAFRPI